jgi:Flp pilus assembly pilin Flp
MAQLTDRVTRQALTWMYRVGDAAKREEGQDAMEYAVVAAVVVVVVAGTSTVFSTSIKGAIGAAFNLINTTISGISA